MATAAVTASTRTAPMPARAGIGLRSGHHDAVLEDRPPVGFLEVHSENYFDDGGRDLAVLAALARDYPLSLHGVGLSPGSADPLDERHLDRLARLAARFEPLFVSEHLAWNRIGGRCFNDLLPLPLTEESLALVTARVGRIQDRLGRQILMENPSSYLQYRHSTIPEPEFLAALAHASGCALLIDVNNVYVSAVNHGFDPRAWLAAVPSAAVAEIHLAGHRAKRTAAGTLLVDTHDGPVCAEVWSLYSEFVTRIGPRPTLVEWDVALPPLDVLVAEARAADVCLEDRRAVAA